MTVKVKPPPGNTYTVTFHANGGSGAPSPQTVSAGSSITLPNQGGLTRNGYSFGGWNTNNSGTGTTYSAGSSYTPSGNVTLYAKWEAIPNTGGTYTIFFDANGGTVNPPYSTTGADGKLASLPTPTRSDVSFAGWYTADSTLVTTNTVFSANATIYARYAYTITFDAKGGTVNPISGATDANGRLTSLPTPTRSGYNFVGWYGIFFDPTSIMGTGIITENTVFLFGTTVYAQWIGIPTPTKTTFTDGRDGKNYQKVTIGTQVWMAENLNYNLEDSKCYGEDGDVWDSESMSYIPFSGDVQANCEKYGRMYNWSTAMNGASSSNKVPSEVQGVCPVGWHLPSSAEWDILVKYVGGELSVDGALTAGTNLKAATGWSSSSSVPVGTDDYGFSALPGGFATGGRFERMGEHGYWRSTTDNFLSGDAAYLFMPSGGASVISNSKSYRVSIRCVQN
jgi:uncharacterized protein (TIGR02145 family)/uncharacterized repeat protein (TIGR02543 family)